jgi:hypothetical protein
MEVTATMPSYPKSVFVVVRRIRLQGSHHSEAALFVYDVPENVDGSVVKEKLEAAGHHFKEFGVEWANHRIVALRDADSEVRRAWRRAESDAEEGEPFEFESITWPELVKEAGSTEVLFLRVPSELKEALAQKASAEKVSVNEYCARALAAAAR